MHFIFRSVYVTGAVTSDAVWHHSSWLLLLLLQHFTIIFFHRTSNRLEVICSALVDRKQPFGALWECSRPRVPFLKMYLDYKESLFINAFAYNNLAYQ